MKAVIYARYSSDNQTEASIEGQLRECMEFAERTEIDVIGNYIDRALTAKTDNRPEFQRMIKDSYKHAFDCIIVWKLDRFARNRYDSAHYKSLLKKNGVKVISAKESIGEGSEGILLESVLEGMAEYYSAELAEKVSRGMTENVLKGLCNGGQVTFGYKVNAEHCYEKDELTSPIVEQIFEMYSDGYKIKEIVDYLNEHNIRTYRNGKMTINIVQRMLSNRRYIGEYKFQKTVVPNGIPAIISEELFNRVQEILAKNKRSPARKKAEDEYLLTLKLFCGKCGAHMVGESGTGTSRVYRYYKCANTKKVHICDKKPVRKEWIEDLAVKAALDILKNDEIKDYLTDRIYALQGEENPRIPKLKGATCGRRKTACEHNASHRTRNYFRYDEREICRARKGKERTRNNDFAGENQKAVLIERTNSFRNREVRQTRYFDERRKTTFDRRFYKRYLRLRR